MEADPAKMSDAEVIKLAEAERDAGVPDVQTAEPAAAAKRRSQDLEEPEAHPS
jgi:hypothetical protein